MSFREIWQFPLINLSDGTQLSLSQLVMALIFLLAGMFVLRRLERLVARQLERRGLAPNAVLTARRATFYALLVVLVITTLGILNIPITAMAFATGALAIGVGFGAQAIINNFISGWILMTERPVRIGDFIEVDGSNGTVEIIGNRSTRIRRTDGVHLLVPNSQMLERTVVNWTLVDDRIRTSVSVGVAYGSPVREVERLLQQAMAEHPAILREPAPVVVFEEFGDNALLFDSYFWVEVRSVMELRRIRSDMRFRIDELFREQGIVIAFPQRDIHFDRGQPLEIRLTNGGTQAADEGRSG